MIKELLKLANHLDSKGLIKETNYLDFIIKKMAHEIEGEEEGDTRHLHKVEPWRPAGTSLSQTWGSAAEAEFFEMIMAYRKTKGYAKNWEEYDKKYGPGVHNAWNEAVESGNLQLDEPLQDGEDYWSYVEWYHKENKSREQGWPGKPAEKITWLRPADIILELNYITSDFDWDDYADPGPSSPHAPQSAHPEHDINTRPKESVLP